MWAGEKLKKKIFFKNLGWSWCSFWANKWPNFRHVEFIVDALKDWALNKAAFFLFFRAASQPSELLDLVKNVLFYYLNSFYFMILKVNIAKCVNQALNSHSFYIFLEKLGIEIKTNNQVKTIINWIQSYKSIR